MTVYQGPAKGSAALLGTVKTVSQQFAVCVRWPAHKGLGGKSSAKTGWNGNIGGVRIFFDTNSHQGSIP